MKRLNAMQRWLLRRAYNISWNIRGDWSDLFLTAKRQRFLNGTIDLILETYKGRGTEETVGLLKGCRSDMTPCDMTDTRCAMRALWPNFEKLIEMHGVLDGEQDEHVAVPRRVRRA